MTNEFLQMNIFFVIASLAAVIFIVLIIILLVYLIKIVKNVKYISDKARVETDNLAEDVQMLRANIRKTGFKLKHIMDFIVSIFTRSNNKKKGK